MTTSMTGFGTSRYLDKDTEVYCEIKSVNHRFLDVSIKPNDISHELDLYIREAISKKVKRGSIDIRFKLKFPSENTYIVNQGSIKNLLSSIKDLKSVNTKDIKFSDIKDVPGIIKTEQNIRFNKNLVKKIFKEALDLLIENRKIEGEKIKKIFMLKINPIKRNIKKLSSSNKKLTKIRSGNLKDKVEQLCGGFEGEKLIQEVALLAIKHDVAEEIERINFHLESLSKELSLKNCSGKKIDFILQELFRETSTLSVKLDHPQYKQLALDMKLSVEEMREQAQNIE